MIKYRTVIIKDDHEYILNKIGEDNWELVGFQNSLYIFKKKIVTKTKKSTQQAKRSTTVKANKNTGRK